MGMREQGKLIIYEEIVWPAKRLLLLNYQCLCTASSCFTHLKLYIVRKMCNWSMAVESI